MVQKFDSVKNGYNTVCEIGGVNRDMRMDIYLLEMKAGETRKILEPGKETAVLLLTGGVELAWEGASGSGGGKAARDSIFDEDPWALHAPRATAITVRALRDSELIVQKTDNAGAFAPKFYRPQDCRSDIFGDGEWNGTARRVVRTVFDYGNAPYSNMVLGEVITFPGKYSSYPPHHHPQPEVYVYKFNKPQGFGFCAIGDQAYRITDNSFALITCGLDHPQTSAPGYAMYYCWMIRHLEGNPWKDRIVNKDHLWLCEKNVKIWPEK